MADLSIDELQRKLARQAETIKDLIAKLSRGTADQLSAAMAAQDFVHKIYPCTIIPARYGGVYEGSQWLAFPSYEVPDAATGDDIACSTWHGQNGQYLGHGDTPNRAALDLAQKIDDGMDTKTVMNAWFGRDW